MLVKKGVIEAVFETSRLHTAMCLTCQIAQGGSEGALDKPSGVSMFSSAKWGLCLVKHWWCVLLSVSFADSAYLVKKAVS